MELADNEQVILVNWVNGTGKTSFLNSIAWCLTGREVFTSDRYLPNGQAVKDSFNSGEPISVEVEISLRDGDGLETIVTRTQEFRATSLDSVINQNESRVVIQYEDVEKGLTSMGPTEGLQWLQETFPPALIDNFLVNGQKWGSDRKAKKGAVEAIARIDAFTKVIEHLVKVESELRSEAKPQASASEYKLQLAEASKVAEQALRDFDESVETSQNAIDDFERQHGPFEEWWENVAESGALKEKVDSLRTVIASARNDQATLKKTIAESLSLAIPSALLSSEISKLNELIVDQASGGAPPWLVEKIIEDKTCICGREVSGQEAALIELASHSDQSVLADFFALDKKSVDSTRMLGHEASGSLREQLKSLRTAINNELAAEGELKQETANRSSNQLGAYPNTQSAMPVFLKLTKHKALLEGATAERAILAQKANELREKLDQDDEGLSPKAKKARAQASFARSCIEAAEKIRMETIQGVRAKVAEEFERIFRSISSGDEVSWKKFELDEHFDIKIVDHDGQDRRKGFSAGKELSLAFSFALALGKIAGYELPLIADTPFGPMSKDVKVATVGGIRGEISQGGASESRQMFLLMTDEEFSGKVQEAFDELEPTVFLGVYDQETQETTIKKAAMS